MDKKTYEELINFLIKVEYKRIQKGEKNSEKKR